MRRSLLFVLLFGILYGPRFKSVDLMMVSVGVVVLGSLFAYALRRRARIHGGVLFSLFLLLSLSLAHAGLLGYRETTLVELCAKLLAYYLAAAFMFGEYLDEYDGSSHVIIRHAVLATAINGVFVIVAYFLPLAVKQQLQGVFDYESQEIWLSSSRRMFDLSLGGGATASFSFALVVCMALAIPRPGRPPFFLSQIFIISVAAALMGRTGLYFIGPILFVALIPRMRKVTFRGFLALFGLLLTLGVVFWLNWDAFLHSEYFAWASEDIFGESETRIALGRMWFLPDDNLLFGDGHFGRVFPDIIYSDIGYIRSIHAVGFVGCTVLYSWFVYLLHASKSRIILRSGLTSDNIFFILVFLILLMNLKELHFASRGTSVLMFLAFLWSRRPNGYELQYRAG